MSTPTTKYDEAGKKYDEEPEIVAEAIPTGENGEAPVPAGHSRFYCNKCRTVRCIVHDECFGIIKRASFSQYENLLLFPLSVALRSSTRGHFVAMPELHGI